MRRFVSPALAALTPLLLLTSSLLAACGEDPADTSAGAEDAGENTLRLAIRVGGDGPALGDNELFVDVFDTEGGPVEHATVTVEGWMPAHGHGAPSPPTVTEIAPGHYRAFPVVCHMPGAWTITVTATAGAASGEVVLDWTIGG